VFSILKGGLKFGLQSVKIDWKTKIECPIDDESINFVKGIHVALAVCNLKCSPLAGMLRFHRVVEDDYDRYESNLCFERFCETEKICV
jgi:hypothetical protein